MSTPDRIASLSRTTSESSVELELNLDGTGVGEVSTGVRFYDHMLLSLAKHSLIDLRVKAIAPQRLWNQITPVCLAVLKGGEFHGELIGSA